MKQKTLVTLLLLLALPSSTFAASTASSVQASLDSTWIMLGAILVFFMHAGFAMVESGFTRSKNTLNILMKNILTIAIGSILYFIIGFGLMFGTSAGGFTGMDSFLLTGREDIGFFFFQAVFAATCATIISGAVAERMKLSAYLLLTVCMTGVLYPVVGHWVWGGGWLSTLGFVDFAGSTVVHLSGAVGAVLSTYFLGARIGKYDAGKIHAIPGHNIPIGALGVFILWFGWFGFNGGSSLAADTTLVPMIIAATLLSASGAVISSALYSKWRYKKLDPSFTLNGALGGLVGITAGCANVSLPGAIIIGVVAGILLVEAVSFIDRVVKLDDPVGAIAVHGVCGIWGTLAVGLFHTEAGLFYGGGIGLVGIQAIGVLSVIAWMGIGSGVVVYTLKRTIGIRVSTEEEIAGLDFTEHGSNAYEWKDSILTDYSSYESLDAYPSTLASRLNTFSTPKNEIQQPE